MAIAVGRLLRLNEMRPGDILIEYDTTPEHSMLWVGGLKPIAHSADSDNSSGIVMNAAHGLGAAQGEPLMEVYRCSSSKLANQAAAIGSGFAIPSNDPRYIRSKQNGWGVNLATRFSQSRLGGNGGHWNAEARVRAVRAYSRWVSKKALSAKEGVTCSQFVSYTYQAASIAGLASVHPLTRVKIQSAVENGVLDKLHSAPEYAAAVGALRALNGAIDAKMPNAFKVDAKITSVDTLANMLIQDGRFRHVGNLAG